MFVEIPPIPSEISDVCQDFLNEAFRYPPEERPSIFELLEHPFISSFFHRSGLNVFKIDQSSKNTDASYIGESFLNLQTLRGNPTFQSMHTLPRHLSQENALDHPNRTRISLSHMNIIRAKTLRRDSKYSEGGTEDHIDIPARLKRNVTLFQTRESRESIRKQATLPQVYEIKDEEDDYYPSHDRIPWNRQHTGGKFSLAGTPGRKTVAEIHTEESVFEHKGSHIKSIDLSARTRPDEYKKGQGQQVLSSEGDFIDEKFEIKTDPDYGSDEEKENESDKYGHGNGNNFAPVKRSKFQLNIQQKQKIEIISEHNGNESAYIDQEDIANKSSTKAKTPTLTKEEERKRIEAEIMSQLMRTHTKDLNQEMFTDSDKTLNKMDSLQSQGNKVQAPVNPVEDKEAERRRIEAEIMGQLEIIDSNDLSHQSSFKGEAAYSDDEYVQDPM